MNSIRDWLNGSRGYNEGLALFEVYGQDALLLRALKQGYSSYRQERMIAALADLVQVADRPVMAPAEPQHKQVTVAAEVMPEASVPEEEDPYRKDWLPEYMEMNALRHTLLSAPNNEVRGQMAHTILRLERSCMKWWKKRADHKRTGVAPVEEAATGSITDVNAARLRMTNLRTYITKANKLLSNEAKMADAQKRIDRYTVELTGLETLLKNG